MNGGLRHGGEVTKRMFCGSSASRVGSDSEGGLGMLRRYATLVVFLVGSGLGGTVALAQDVDSDAPTPERVVRARQLYQQGAEAFERHRWLECAQAFEQSFTLVFAPELLYNIGRCYAEAARLSRSREHYGRAIAAYRRYMREVEDADNQEIGLAIDQLRAERDLLPPTEEVASPLGAEPEPEESSATDAAAEREPDRQVLSRPVRALPQEQGGFAWTWTMVGASLTFAAAVAAIVTGVVASSEYDSLASTCGQTPEGCGAGQIARVQDLATGTNALLVASGVLLVGTGVAFGVEFVNDAPESTVSGVRIGYRRAF